jgi:hypothetical protein
VPFFAPEEYRDGELLLRCFRPGDGEELSRATTESYEHLRRFMLWPRPDTTVEESEGYARQSRARWLLGEEWAVGVWRGGRLVAGTGFLLRGAAAGPGNGRDRHVGAGRRGRPRPRHPAAAGHG